MKVLLSLFALVFLFNTAIKAQDIIVKYDGKKIKCKVVSVGNDFIEFLPLKKQEGLNYVLSKDEVRMILYENGEVLEFEKAKAQVKFEEGKELYYSSGFWGLNIYQGGFKIKRKDALLAFDNYPISRDLYKKGKMQIISANILSIPSILLLGYELGTLIVGNEPNYLAMTLGALGTLSGILIKVSGNRSIKNAVDGYNTSLDDGVRSSLNFGKTRNGLGLVYSF